MSRLLVLLAALAVVGCAALCTPIHVPVVCDSYYANASTTTSLPAP